MLALSIIWMAATLGVILYYSLYRKTPYYNNKGLVSLPYLLSLPMGIIGAVLLSVALTKPGTMTQRVANPYGTTGAPQRLNTAGIYGR